MNIKSDNKSIFFPISLKLIIIISLILAFSLTGLTYIATYYFQRDSIRRIQEVTSDKSQVIARTVKTEINNIIDKAYLITDSFNYGSWKYGRKKRVSSLAGGQTDYPGSEFSQNRMFAREKGIIYVAVAVKKGNSLSVRADIKNSTVMRNPDEATDFRAIIKKDAALFEKSFSGTTEIHNSSSAFGSPVLCLSIPRKTSLQGYSPEIIIVYFSMDMFIEAVQSFSEYRTFIVNRSGELIAHPDTELMLSNIDFSGSEIVQAMLKSPVDNGQTTYTDEKGVLHLGSFSKTETAGVGVITTVNRDVALEAVYNLRRRNVFITIIVLMLAVIIVYVFAKTLTGPLKRLVSASMEIKEGKYNLSLRPSSHDEIGKLTESFLEMGKGLEEREKMKEAFGKFVNKEIAEQAMKGNLKLGGERKNAAIFFSDIRSFTAISEKLLPEEVVEFLNEYMTAMVDCVNKTFGVVDKFIGDAVMAVWGTPVSHGNDTENAVNGALMMRKALMKFNEGRGGDKKPVIKIGCGINTGPVLAGQIGSHDRMEYTVIGDAVNLASRIEALNKPFSTDILISEASYAQVKEVFNVEPMRKITVKGKAEPQQIYAVIGRKDDPEYPGTLKELRDLLGLDQVDISKVDMNAKEEKYEISS